MARAWNLKSRPDGMPVMDNFELKDLPQQDLSDGQFRVRNSWLSVDPYMRGRMSDAKSYAESFALGEPMTGGAVGEVTESKNDDFPVGAKVLHQMGWRDEAILGGGDMMANKLPETGLEDFMWLGNMGLTGGTAWMGLLKIAHAKSGDIVFVSAAAGAVGSAVTQIAKAKGMTVIGSAGGSDKCEWVKSLGADACIDYKQGHIEKQLREAAPEGIDVYFDNVGGEHLDAAFGLARINARFAICGMIDKYNDQTPVQMKNLMRVIPARIMMHGFLYPDHLDLLPEFNKDMGDMIAKGQVQSRETVKEGLEAAPEAFLGLFTGENTGKMLVKL